MIKETRTRSILKSASYIITHETIFFIIAYLWTKDALQSLAISLSGAAVEAVYYYLHERFWAKIQILRENKKK